MIERDTIQTVIETARIDEVVGEFVNLRKRGSNYVGLCPFHDERTPSFSVSPSKGIYKCFGCGKAGNVIGFIMDHEHYSYPEAIRFLAKKYNIEIEEKEQTPEQQEHLNELETLYNINLFAQQYFTDQLRNNEKGRAVALSYLKERDFKMSAIEQFQLGYSPDAWDGFTAHALTEGYRKEDLVKSGLSIEKDDKLYDRFRGRAMFPVHNLTGRVIAFGGRILTSGTNQPKYINSPETDIYNKSKALYGLYFSKPGIIKENLCYLVEGYTDVISLFQAGIRNVVASSGTSLTVDQIKLIKRYTSNIAILYDGDEAGLQASFRGIDLILEQGMNVRIIIFPEGEDPDSFVRNHRISEVEEFLEQEARDFIEFKTDILLRDAGNDPVKRASLIREIIGSISLIPDAITRSIYVKECSTRLDMDEQTLVNELNKKFRERLKKRVRQDYSKDEYLPEPDIEMTEPQQVTDHTNTEYQEKDIIRLLLQFGDREEEFKIEPGEGEAREKVRFLVSRFIIEDLKSDGISFSNPLYQRIFDEYDAYLSKNDKPPEFEFFSSHPDFSISKTAIDLTLSRYEISSNWEKNLRIHTNGEEERIPGAVVSAVLSLKAKRIAQSMEDIQKQIEEATDEEQMLLLMDKQRKLQVIRNDINGQLGRVVPK